MKDEMRTHLVRVIPPMSEALGSDAPCGWAPDEDGIDVWDTDCDRTFRFDAGGPRDNEFRFCPYCGRRIEERDNAA